MNDVRLSLLMFHKCHPGLIQAGFSVAPHWFFSKCSSYKWSRISMHTEKVVFWNGVDEKRSGSASKQLVSTISSSGTLVKREQTKWYLALIGNIIKQDFVRKFDWILDIAFRRSTLDSFSQERRPCIFGLPNLYEHLANCTCEVITNHEELNDQARANRISHLYLMDAVRR